MREHTAMAKFLILIVSLGCAVLSVSAFDIDPSSGPYYVGNQIGVRTTCSDDCDCTWFWGDGSALAGVDDSTSVWRYHTYTKAGTYTIHLRRYPYITPYCLQDEYRTITIETTKVPGIIFSPPQPEVGDLVTFQTINFDYNVIDWNFGDGTVLTNSAKKVTHSFQTAGTFTVSAKPSGTGTWAASCTVIVSQSVEPQIVFSPTAPRAGDQVSFQAINFVDVNAFDWNFGDGATLASASGKVNHRYENAGSFTVSVKPSGSASVPVSCGITIQAAIVAQINFSPASPRVEDLVTFSVINMTGNLFNWNFGDGTTLATTVPQVSYRYLNEGTYTVSVSASNAAVGRKAASASRAITILADNRRIEAWAKEPRPGKAVTFRAFHFKYPSIRWDFGDGSAQVTAGKEVTHEFKRAGTFIIQAREAGFASQKVFQTELTVVGITDEVNVDVMEIVFDNGKYYSIIPKNFDRFTATLRMKMRGTGIVSGYWVVDGREFEYFSEVVHQGELAAIKTRSVPGLPTIIAGMHTVTVRLTRPAPADLALQNALPVLKYVVLPYENTIALSNPKDGFITRDRTLPQFTWEKASGASVYEIAFSNNLFPLFEKAQTVKWHANDKKTDFVPSAELWDTLARNQWTYWQVRALTGTGQVIAESPIQEFKIILASADITLNRLQDLDGREITMVGDHAESRAENVMVRGEVTFAGKAKFLVLRVFIADELVDQLLFRDMSENEKRPFETVLPNLKPSSRIVFQALSSNSPSVVIGIQEFVLNKSE